MFCWQYHDAQKAEEALYIDLFDLIFNAIKYECLYNYELEAAIFERTLLPPPYINPC